MFDDDQPDCLCGGPSERTYYRTQQKEGYALRASRHAKEERDGPEAQTQYYAPRVDRWSPPTPGGGTPGCAAAGEQTPICPTPPPYRQTPARKIPEQNFRIGPTRSQVSRGICPVIAIAMSDRPP